MMYRDITDTELAAYSLDRGYVVFLDKEHPLNGGYSPFKVFYHRYVASLMLGRWLSAEDQVHRIDGNKLNNNADNLEVLTRAEHARIHSEESGRTKEILHKICPVCAEEYKTNRQESKFCSYTCHKNSLVKNTEITKELLDELIPTHTWTALGRMFNYSDVGIKKRAKALGCKI